MFYIVQTVYCFTGEKHNFPLKLQWKGITSKEQIGMNKENFLTIPIQFMISEDVSGIGLKNTIE